MPSGPPPEVVCPRCRTVYPGLSLEVEGLYEGYCPSCRYYFLMDYWEGQVEYTELKSCAFVRRLEIYRLPRRVRFLNTGSVAEDAASRRFSLLEIDEEEER